MNQIKTWQKRIHKLEGEQGDGFLTIQQAMQQEIDDLRQAIEQAGKVEPVEVTQTFHSNGKPKGYVLPTQPQRNHSR